MDSRSTPILTIAGIDVLPGERRRILLKVSESFLAGSVHIPIHVLRGVSPGPTVFITAAIHGDEINGTDIVRRLVYDVDHDTLSGTIIAVPVVNIPGFHSQSRYVQYNRDLNRFFPGKARGNNAERFANHLFSEIIRKCDFGIDLHTAGTGRSNLPHVRGDMGNPIARRLARAFGAAVVIDSRGVPGSLRREATDAGVPTILFEAGETGKFSKRVSLGGLRGLLGILREAKMLPKAPANRPPFQVIVKRSEWVRARKGGILDLDVQPGDLIYADDEIGRVLNPFGKTVTGILAPHTGIVIGVATEPLTVPGTGVINVARLRKTLKRVERSIAKQKQSLKDGRGRRKTDRSRRAR